MRTTTGGALSLLVCAALLTGCGDGEQEPDADAGASPTSASASPSESEPSEEPSVELPTGPVVELGSLTVTFPEGFKPRESSSIGGDLVTATGPDGMTRLALVAAEDFSRESLDRAVDIAIEAGFWVGRPKRLDDVEVDGVTMYHLSGPAGGGLTEVQFGAEHGGYDVTFTVSSSASAAEREELVDAILASATWA